MTNKTKAELVEENKRLHWQVKMLHRELEKIKSKKTYQLLEALMDEMKDEMYKIHFSE